MSRETKTYLGDAVYAEIDRGMIKLTAEDGWNAINTIYLEPEVYGNLTAYVARMKKAASEKEAQS